jgi:hypothetical protein
MDGFCEADLLWDRTRELHPEARELIQQQQGQPSHRGVIRFRELRTIPVRSLDGWRNTLIILIDQTRGCEGGRKQSEFKCKRLITTIDHDPTPQ